MYGLVPYNISPIQQGIQFGHAVVEYSLYHNDDVYDTWARHDKTFIILNGGTTNKSMTMIGTSNGIPKGTLNQYVDSLIDLGIKASCFYEPDLGDQLTAVVFLLDERIWDRETFPDFEDRLSGKEPIPGTLWSNETLKITHDEYYEELWGWDWKKILEKRQFISQFRLA
jgi:hypothetical protein